MRPYIVYDQMSRDPVAGIATATSRSAAVATTTRRGVSAAARIRGAKSAPKPPKAQQIRAIRSTKGASSPDTIHSDVPATVRPRAASPVAPADHGAARRAGSAAIVGAEGAAPSLI